MSGQPSGSGEVPGWGQQQGSATGGQGADAPPQGDAPPQESAASPGAGASAAAGVAATAANAATEAFRTRLGMGEQLAVVGAALIVLVELVMGMLLLQYWAGDVAFLLGIAVLAGFYQRHVRGRDVPLGHVTVIRVAGVAIAALAIVDLSYELRTGVFDDVPDIVGGAAYYVGAALMALGALRIGDEARA